MKISRLNNTTPQLLKIGIAVALVAFVFVARIAPHPANFAPVAAVALFAGALLPRRWAPFVPITAMILSDLIIGLHPLIFYTWGSFAVIALASSKWLTNATAVRVGLSSMAASVFFYLVTNFGVWAQGTMYTMNVPGLIHCYVNALPFFRGTLTGDLFYSGVLFGAYVFVSHFVRENKVSATV